MMSMAAARAALDSAMAKMNAISGHSGVIKIFTGSAPATCETADSGTALSTGCTFSATAFAASTDPGSTGLATATANAITADTNAANTGTAGYFRGYSFDGATYTCHLQGTVGTSSADMIVNTTSIVAGETVTITSLVVTLPDGSGAD
jgi:hypothetical protein